MTARGVVDRGFLGCLAPERGGEGDTRGLGRLGEECCAVGWRMRELVTVGGPQW